MDCNKTRLLFSDAQGGRLSPDDQEQRQSHLRECEPCREVERAEGVLTDVLREHLPSHPASPALKSRLEARWLTPTAGPARPRRWPRALLVPTAVLAGMALAFVAGFSTGKGRRGADHALADEAVSDHLRMLDGESPMQVIASDVHQVKPWFAGKLDFAPPVAFGGDDDFPLLGGRVTRFLEQRAACFVFGRRLHKISLFVVPARGPESALPATPQPASTMHGFSVLAWQAGEFDYVLVSDLNGTDLLELADRIQAAR